MPKWLADHVLRKASGDRLMTSDREFKRFRWRDRGQYIWDVYFVVTPIGFSGFVVSRHTRKSSLIYVQTLDQHSQQQLIARIADVRVDRQVENRGIGSMLVREVISECKRRGHKGIDGYLSSVDRDHFSKLKQFYEKLGFSVVFYEKDHPADYNRPGVGKIEMFLDDGPVG